MTLSKDTALADLSLKDTVGFSAAQGYIKRNLNADLEKGIIDSLSRGFRLASADLNDDGQKEVFVFFTGPYFCGSGGCTVVLLASNGLPVTKFTVMDAPVLVSDEKNNGWKNIICYSKGKNRILRFDGKKYPSNPSISEETKIPENARKLFDVSDDKPSFTF